MSHNSHTASHSHKLYPPSMKRFYYQFRNKKKFSKIKMDRKKVEEEETNGCSFTFSVIMIFMIVLENTENKFLGTKWVKLLIRYCNCTRLGIFFISSIIYHCASFIHIFIYDIGINVKFHFILSSYKYAEILKSRKTLHRCIYCTYTHLLHKDDENFYLSKVCIIK